MMYLDPKADLTFKKIFADRACTRTLWTEKHDRRCTVPGCFRQEVLC